MKPEYQDAKFLELKKKYDTSLLDFIKENSAIIINQLDQDKNYQLGLTEVPKIPVFDKYLSELEATIREEMQGIGYFNGAAYRLVQRYKNVFYYSSLPNLTMEQRPDYDKSIVSLK